VGGSAFCCRSLSERSEELRPARRRNGGEGPRYGDEIIG
jgi:hypothetical protein